MEGRSIDVHYTLSVISKRVQRCLRLAGEHRLLRFALEFRRQPESALRYRALRLREASPAMNGH